MKWLVWSLGVLACALLWIVTGALILVPLLMWPLSDAHYDGPWEIFLDPSYLFLLLLCVGGTAVLTSSVFKYWNQQR
jgi:hypothetical protein